MKTSFLKIIFALIFFLSPFIVSASTTDNISGFAWSSNIGWISFNSTNCDTDANGHIDSGPCGGDNTTGTVTNYGVNEDSITGFLIGYAWSPNIGWIQFGNLSGWPTTSQAPGTTSTNAQMTGNSLKGWAKALSADGNGWDGWISLSGTTTSGSNYGVTLTSTGSTSPSQYTCKVDCAWGGDVLGWVDFSGVIVAGTALPVVTNPTTSSITNTRTTLRATITSLGIPNANGAGFVYDTSSHSQNDGYAYTYKNVFLSNIVLGTYMVHVTGLSAGTTYYFRGFATNSAGTAYSPDPEGTFRTACTAPLVWNGTSCVNAGARISGQCPVPVKNSNKTCVNPDGTIDGTLYAGDYASYPSKVTWTCHGSNGGADTPCSEPKGPGFIEN